MKSKDLLDAMNDMDHEMVEAADTARRVKKRSLGWWAIAACFCLAVAVLTLPLWNGGDLPAEDSIYWVDARERVDGRVMTSEIAVEFAWKYLPVFKQYGQVTFEGREYVCHTASGAPIPVEYIGEKLGETTAEGYDEMEETVRSIECGLYRIEGLDAVRWVAVKYAGQDVYYPFASGEYLPPETLGDLISTLNLTEFVPLDLFYHESRAYGLLAEDGAALWQMLLKYADTPLEVDAQPMRDTKRVGFSMSSAVLGIENLSLSVYEDGYLFTNVEQYGYYFYVGPDATREITSYALAHKTESAYEKQYLAGIVTEIGDGYIKVDDSIMMKNPDDGMVFTVYTDHPRISPYISSGYIKVGERVRVVHGRLSKENPTEIRNATEIAEAIITGDGDVLIPE